MPPEEPKITRAGFVALVGRPNVGKSTLLNALLGQKIAIASPRPQTTRNRILGVKSMPERGAQIVFVDTPGLHRPSGRGRSPLNRFMMGEAMAALEEVDALVLLVEVKPDPGDRFAVAELKRVGKPALVAINKVDAARDKRQLLPAIERWSKEHGFQPVIPISARTGDGLDRLVDAVVKLLPEGPALFPDEVVTDRPERWLAAELVREQVFLLTRQEVPYAVAVTIDAWETRASKADRKNEVVVSATIHVEKEAQKKIVVGEGGRMVRDIGTRARMEMGRLLDCVVHLKLFVRVDEDWTQDRAQLRELGYERDS